MTSDKSEEFNDVEDRIQSRQEALRDLILGRQSILNQESKTRNEKVGELFQALEDRYDSGEP